MQRFKDILVAVDLSQGEWFVSSELRPPSLEAVERALWLAKLNSARLTFFYAHDMSAAARRLIDESNGDSESILDEANDVLSSLVARAAEEGVFAEHDARFGKSWLEIIRHVLRNDHDLVVAGSRCRGGMHSLLMGSTGIKLLRKCPCPVWITRPQPDKQIKSILVAHCLREVGDLAMELGCSMAQFHGAQLHVLHSLEFPEMDHALPALVPAKKVTQFRSDAQQHIDAQLKKYNFARPPQVHIVTDAADYAVLKHIEKHGVELVTMGTIARTGIAGFITGNTAERLLPQIPCSVLAVKPSDFVSPVSI